MSQTALWTAAEAASATGGVTRGGWSATGISIDTRTLNPGDLFVALKGERDGHMFVAAALNKSAAACLVSHIPGDVNPDAPLLLVGNTQTALEALGRAARGRTPAKIIAVTGSAGKTTTKEMLRLMLSAQGSVAASAASYNNHWGVPLSLARMPRDAQFGVFEIGMNHAGEIHNLVHHVRPHVAVITTIAPAHIEYFGTLEAIADAKAEIFEGLEPGGAGLIPIDNVQFARLRKRAEQLGISPIVTFGTHLAADARLVSATPADGGQRVAARILSHEIEFRIGALGRHIALNAIAALAAVKLAGGNIELGAAELANFAPLKGRGARTAAGEIEIIDESYNANPASMTAALDVLAATSPGHGGRRIAVLGDMLELGEQADHLHAGLAGAIASAKVDLVFLCGPHMRALWAVIPTEHRGAYAPASGELAPELVSRLRPGDVVLVKGSLGSRMAVIVEAVKNREPASAPAPA